MEPGNFRIGRVGRAHNDYYEVALKDRYDGGEYYDDGDGDGNDGDGDGDGDSDGDGDGDGDKGEICSLQLVSAVNLRPHLTPIEPIFFRVMH